MNEIERASTCEAFRSMAGVDIYPYSKCMNCGGKAAAHEGKTIEWEGPVTESVNPPEGFYSVEASARRLRESVTKFDGINIRATALDSAVKHLAGPVEGVFVSSDQVIGIAREYEKYLRGEV